MARILITGARGMLGQRLAESFARGHEVVLAARHAEPGVRALDLEDAAAIDACVRAVRPDWIVNAAAYTAVDLAETEAAKAFRVNAEAPEHLARAAARVGARCLHYSTDFVFGGEAPGLRVETDPVGPISVYARSKEEGERRVREALPDGHLIVRVAWLFGPEGKNFVATMLKLGRERDRLRVVDDQTGTPTYTRDAADLAVRLVEAGLLGTVHGANQGVTTWCGFARRALALAGISTPVDAIATHEYKTAAVRPKNSALHNAVLEATIGNTMRPFEEALQAYLVEVGAAR